MSRAISSISPTPTTASTSPATSSTAPSTRRGRTSPASCIPTLAPAWRSRRCNVGSCRCRRPRSASTVISATTTTRGRRSTPTSAMRIVDDLGAHDALIMRNHGLLTCGATIQQAFNTMYQLEMSCRSQVDAMAARTELTMPGENVLAHTAHLYQPGTRRPYGVLEWPAMLRLLAAQEKTRAIRRIGIDNLEGGPVDRMQRFDDHAPAALLAGTSAVTLIQRHCRPRRTPRRQRRDAGRHRSSNIRAPNGKICCGLGSARMSEPAISGTGFTGTAALAPKPLGAAPGRARLT